MSSEDYKRLFALTGNSSIHNLSEWKAAAVLLTFSLFFTKTPIKAGMRDEEENHALVLTLIANDMNG